MEDCHTVLKVEFCGVCDVYEHDIVELLCLRAGGSPHLIFSMKTVDLRRASYDEFLTFVFDHSSSAADRRRAKQSGDWYHHVNVRFRPTAVARHYVRLFTEPKGWAERYDDRQLERGFWAINGYGLECGVSKVIWMESVRFEVRADVVRSMFHLFERFFLAEQLESWPFMWWDTLAYDWSIGHRSRARGGEDRQMQDVMFETLEQILWLPSGETRQAALHGLGHLRHPRTPALIQRWLRKHGKDDPLLAKYAREAAHFKVQ
jgi:hypothetical protein